MMRRMSTRVSAARAVRIRRILRRLGLVVVPLLLFVAFVVGIRHVPPDGMTVRYETGTLVPSSDGSFGPRFTHTTYIYTAPRDKQTINATYASLNNGRAYDSLFDHFNCPLTSAPIPSSIEFTRHGVLLETWWPSGCTVRENAGGADDAFGLTYHYWMPPSDGIPLPALN